MLLTILVILSIVIIGALAAYAAYLWRQVKVRQQAVAEVGEEQGRENAIENIRSLAAAMVNNDLNITEGSIRITVMLDYLYDCGNMPDTFLPFKKLHDGTLHMPRRKARQNVSVAQLKKLDREREALEAQHKTAVLDAAKTALDYAF